VLLFSSPGWDAGRAGRPERDAHSLFCACEAAKPFFFRAQIIFAGIAKMRDYLLFF
jgi:hypothetical protein